MKIPKPTGRMVQESVHRTLVVWVDGQYVVYIYQRARITLSITGDHPGDNHPEQRSIHRHLIKLAARPERSGPMERLERGESLAEVAELWMMDPDSLRRVLMSEVDEQHRFGHIDAVRHARLMGLLDVRDNVGGAP